MRGEGSFFEKPIVPLVALLLQWGVASELSAQGEDLRETIEKIKDENILNEFALGDLAWRYGNTVSRDQDSVSARELRDQSQGDFCLTGDHDRKRFFIVVSGDGETGFADRDANGTADFAVSNEMSTDVAKKRKYIRDLLWDTVRGFDKEKLVKNLPDSVRFIGYHYNSNTGEALTSVFSKDLRKLGSGRSEISGQPLYAAAQLNFNDRLVRIRNALEKR